jgi:DNA-directed RNA polymerase subunit E'/Rpb7
MFVLAEFKDTISIHPRNFKKSKSCAIEDEINYKYGHKVGIL